MAGKKQPLPEVGGTRPPKIREDWARFVRYFLADPQPHVAAAARHLGRERTWGFRVLRQPDTQAYIHYLSGMGIEELYGKRRSTKAEIEQIKGIRRVQAELIPTETDAARVFNRLKTFMDFRLVDLVTNEGPVAIDAEKVRALKGTEEGRAIKKIRHRHQIGRA